ncbi:MAG: Ig-like domain-containing protein [Pseudomonadota bacterium]
MKPIFNHFALALALVLAFGLTGCNDSSDYDFDASAEAAQETYDAENEVQPRPLFNPAEGVIPSATNLLFLGSEDFTLNIPIDPLLDSAGEQALKATLNELDGFSTSSPVTVEFSTTLDPASVTAAGSVRLFEVVTDLATGAVIGVSREVTAAEYLAIPTGVNQDTLVIQPLVPLRESSSYLAVFTNGITDAAGIPAKADTVYRLLKSTEPFTGDLLELEPLRLLTQTFEFWASSQGIDPADIVLSWVFTTQSITKVLETVADAVLPGAITVAPTGMDTKTADPRLQGKADVYIGTLEIPYYLTAPSDTDPTAALTEYWTGVDDSALTWFNPIPVTTDDNQTQTIPLLLTLPNSESLAGAMPAGGWPVVIFQHGITQDRSNLLAIADALADAGFAAVAIDMPLHGITDSSNPLHADNTPYAETERTFNMDFVDNSTGAAGPDGLVDPSGQHFINLQSLLTSRDNMRQAAADLLVLHQSLADITAVGLDSTKVNFVGHSLGAMAGTVFLALDSQVGAASLAMPGGGIARLLDGSATFGPIIQAGLAANGVEPGTEEYDAFMVVAQTAVDSGDPINFGARAAQNHPIHMIEVVSGVDSLPDQVIPNEVSSAPLSGTEPLARIMDLASISVTTSGTDGVVRFTLGEHSSMLDPTASLEATVEMQSEIAAFMATMGGTIFISNGDVIE